MPKNRYMFKFCDPIASFSPGSPGAAAQRITGTGGFRLGQDAWRLGSKAYERLRSKAGAEVSIDEILCFMDAEEPYLDEFMETLIAAAKEGRIALVDPAGKPQDLSLDWRDATWSWKLITMVRFIDGLPTSEREPVGASFGAQILVAALVALDDAVLDSLSDNHDGVSERLLECAWLVDRVESIERAEKDARALLKLLDTNRASERAKLRHAQDPKRAARDFVRLCWEDWRKAPGSYPSASAFARAMLDKHPDTLTSEVVVARWVRKWNREADQPGEN